MTLPKSESDISSFQDAAKARISLVMKKKRAQQMVIFIYNIIIK
jgi:hypothetical protein